MKGLYSAAALVALLLVGCADGGPTSPPLGTADSPFAGGLSFSEMTDEDGLMRLMGGGIEDAMEGAEPALAASTQAAQTAIDVPGALATRAFGINAGGEIVGSYTDATGTHGYLWAKGAFTIIKVPGAMSTEAWGINPQGDIVGRYRIAGDARTFGFLLSDGVFTDISVPGHLHTLPIKISPSGEIVGCFHDTNFLVDMRGYVQRGDQVTSFELLPSTMHNGVTLGGRVIAGISFESADVVHGYVLDRGVYTQFDVPGATFTEAWDVSPKRTVVGYFNPVTSHGFSRDAKGRFTVIDVPGALWTRIFGINPQGDIVGSYADASNSVHGFRLFRTVRVDPNRRGDGSAKTIQEGIDMVAPGGRVRVAPGTYHEQVTVSKNDVVIVADDEDDEDNGPGGVVVNADGHDFGFLVLNASGVTIEGFRVEHAHEADIVLDGATFTRIRKNVTTAAGHDGIQLIASNDNVIEDNVAIDNLAENACGVNVAAGSTRNVVRENRLVNNEWGIQIAGAATLDNVISENRALRNRGNGIRNIGGASGTIIEENSVVENGLAPSTLTGTTAAGIRIGSGVGIVVRENRVFGNLLVELLQDAAATATFADNQCGTSSPAGLCEGGEDDNGEEEPE